MNWRDKHNFVGPMIPNECLKYRRMENLNKEVQIQLTPDRVANIKHEEDKKLRSWSRLVRQRDGHQCTSCGSSSLLHAHHIKSKHEYPSLKYDVNNGTTLCYDCHADAHKNDRVSSIMMKNKRYSRRDLHRG